MTKGEIIKSWIPYNLTIPETENPNNPMFLPIYLNTYNIGCDEIDDIFVIQSKYTLDLKSGKLKTYSVTDNTDRFPFHPYNYTDDLLSKLVNIFMSSQSDNFYKDSESDKMILNSATFLEKKHISSEIAYTDAIYVEMIATSDENGNACLFDDCKVTINLYRIFSSMPEDLINAKCSEAYDKMKDIQQEMEDTLNKSLVNKIVGEKGNRSIEFVDCTLVSLKEMYKTMSALNMYYSKK